MTNTNLLEESREKSEYVVKHILDTFKDCGQVDCRAIEFSKLKKYHPKGMYICITSETLSYEDHTDKLGDRRELWSGIKVWFEDSVDKYEAARYIKDEILSKFNMPAFYDEDGTLGNFRYSKCRDDYSLTFYVNPFYKERKWQNHVL